MTTISAFALVTMLVTAPAMADMPSLGSCRVTFEQRGTLHKLPRWYLVVDRNPEQGFVSGEFIPFVRIKATVAHKNGTTEEDRRRMILGDLGRATTRELRYFTVEKLNVIKVEAVSCIAYPYEEAKWSSATHHR